MRKVFFKTLEEIAKKDKDVYLLVADLGIKFFDTFQKIDPERFINAGIAEANMIGVAAGLALSGKNVYCYSIIPFLTMRTFEQIRLELCYNNLNVKLLGAGGGLVYGPEGVTHHAIEDIAIMRALPNMTIVAPGDALEAKALVEQSVSYQGPLYIRFGRDVDPVIHKDKDFNFQIGKGITVKEGSDICLIATGSMLYPVTLVLEILKKENFNPTLISMHTIKPLDEELVRDCAKNHKAIFTLEEHNIIGGLGSAVAEVLAELGYSGKFKRIGIPDKFCPETGSVDYLRKKFGLDPEAIAERIMKEYKNI